MEPFGLIPIALPSFFEQQTITAFLDRELAKIDALIAKQTEFRTRLDEHRRALISEAVRHGFDGTVPMESAGSTWLGTVHADWSVLPLRRVVSKFIDYRGSTPDKIDSGIPLITATSIRFGRIDHSHNPVFVSAEEYKERMVRGLPAIDDVVLTTEAPLGEVAQISELGQAIGQRVILLKVDENYMLPRMLFYYFISPTGQGELWSTASGSTAIGIKAERLKGIRVIVPPLQKQMAIVTYLDDNLSKFDPIEDAAKQQVNILRERRAALITAAVTGQIDVREPSLAEAAA
jgi:type I restriction enzyme S subunit